MATKQGKKVKFKVRNLFSRNKYKKFSKSKERAPVRKESDESITTLGDDVEESKGLYLDLEVNQTVVSHSQQQPKRRSVKLDVGDLLYGGQGGQQDRETEPFSSDQTAPDTDGEERARPGEEQDLGLRLVTKEDEEENSSSDTKTAEKVFSAEVHTDSSGAENGTQSDKHVMKNTGPQSGTEELSFSKKGEGKSKKKRKKVTFSPTSTKYIQLEASQETLDIYVVEEQTIKKKKSKKKKIRKRVRKAARLSWRYLMAGFQNMTLATPFYVTTTTVESMYTPRPSYP
ncbi:PREDICTED: uncharacterized protein LOC109483771 [Branchiostoma belcheri]|uniref:Uncharacterized protein LOC109483771 n=1 Tax=Branchiostoma belcheri TaxID=7741 RepID=A0A6P5AGP8_BRABE|nr:PREDICTED: uncharacterized protein LOC109483771 [Branchiostoma belcheri]XP_019642418.1 PREDICTED: uncharacterized protein LOC109483771 [Branchiostoma belcheri]XP_019642419.1 PREDICTED: uncharacterized protein LOC109483771 [Branchiostoma belcheri]XP_019642420.1 PREDICTED: uncharacterized protein LOC109483771 [Branchiostoma belcheri]XP_019642421.1 PREDICTED: uncharacterized protein LOC109483771 [Branchiostoma belcheri]